MHLITSIVRAMAAFTGNEANPLRPVSHFYCLGPQLHRHRIAFRAISRRHRNGIYGCRWCDACYIRPDVPYARATSTYSSEAFYSLTVRVNVLFTLLIALKIWQIQRQAASHVCLSTNAISLSRITKIVIES
ncbi:hypothetical protein AcV5_005714, partial [Taiwanofungus camphoratus]